MFTNQHLSFRGSFLYPLRLLLLSHYIPMMVIIMDTHYTRNVPMIQDQYLPSWGLFKLPMKVPIYALFLPASRDLCRWVFWPSVLDSCDPPSISWSISHVWRFFPQKSTCFLIPFWGKTRIDPPFFLKQCTVRGSIPCFLMSYVWPRSSKTRLVSTHCLGSTVV